MTVHAPRHASARGRLKISDRGRFHAAFSRAVYDRGGEWVFAVLFHRRRCAEQLLLGNRISRNNGGHARVSFGEGPGLVHNERAHFFHQLHCFGFLDKHSSLRTTANADHYRHRCGKTECAGAGDDQHCDGIHDAVCEPRLGSDKPPNKKRDDRDCDNRGDEPTSHFVGQSLDGCAAALRLRDHLHDLRKDGFTADTFRFDDNAAGLINGAAGDTVVFCFFHGHRFTGDHRFVDARSSFDDATINRYLFAGAHT